MYREGRGRYGVFERVKGMLRRVWKWR